MMRDPPPDLLVELYDEQEIEMAFRRSFPVHVFRTPKIGEKLTIIAITDREERVFALRADDSVAECASAKRLSDWAFEHGANEVRHDYDGKLSDNEA